MKNLLIETILSESNSMTFFHGGNLDDYQSFKSHKTGRYEFGVGLYLTTEPMVAERYSKGSRKLYIVTIAKGNDIDDSFLDYDKVVEFINKNVKSTLKKKLINICNDNKSNNKIPAYLLNNIIINNNAITSTKTGDFRNFLVSNNIDYEMVKNQFGYGDTTCVLYNTNKILNVERITMRDERFTKI